MVVVNPLTNLQAQTQAQTQAQNQGQTAPFVYQNSTQRVETQAQFLGGTGTKSIPIPPEMATLAPVRRV